MLCDIISSNAQKNPTAAAARLEALAGSLNAEQQSFAWGILGTAQAKTQNMAAALAYYQKAAQPAQFGLKFSKKNGFLLSSIERLKLLL